MESWIAFASVKTSPQVLMIEDRKPVTGEALDHLQDGYDAMNRCIESVTRLGMQGHKLPAKHQSATMLDAIHKALQVKKDMQSDMDEMTQVLMSPPASHSTSDVKAMLKKSSKAFSMLLGLEKECNDINNNNDRNNNEKQYNHRI